VRKFSSTFCLSNSRKQIFNINHKKSSSSLNNILSENEEMNEYLKQKNWFKKTKKLKTEVSALQKKIGQLESQLESNKVFTFMVIHDLKHPTEAVVA
jgi:hypothetical protein